VLNRRKFDVVPPSLAIDLAVRELIKVQVTFLGHVRYNVSDAWLLWYGRACRTGRSNINVKPYQNCA